MEQRERRGTAATLHDDVRRGRIAFLNRAWADAYQALVRADANAALDVEDLERFASSAYLVGREDEYLEILGRVHRAYADAGQWARAARYAFWMGLSLFFRGATGPATGWLGRAQRLVEREGGASGEAGYLLLPNAERQLAKGNGVDAHAIATEALEIGERFGELDLIACARHLQGRALLQQARVEQGLALLDEAMVAVVADQLSPLMTGLIYCSVIESCMQVYALGRARDWTSALSRWCEAQPQLVSFTGTCLVHRAEILEQRGAWREALEEAGRACVACVRGGTQHIAAAALYRQGELHRLRGEFGRAEEAYREASRHGFEPQPGLALLRLAQGRVEASATAIRRVVRATADALARTRLLPASVEILLAAGDVEGAHSALCDLEETARWYDTGALGAMVTQARGTIALAEGDTTTALSALRRAFEFWQAAETPYLAARMRELIGTACRTLGDDEGAEMELDAARIAYEGLGAKPDLARLTGKAKDAISAGTHGLTKRELHVLRLVAAGKTNKAIAAELFVSQRTVDRHLSNLFAKLDISSRTAAVAYAHKRQLI